MKKTTSPFEKYLVRMILIIDQDQTVVERLSGMVAKLGGEATSFVKTGAVDGLEDAESFLRKQEADVVIIDPAIESLSKSVNFIRRSRFRYPRIVWVLNTHDSWWKKFEASLSATPFGKRLCRYYRMSKNNTGRRAKTDFVNALVKCHHDYVLRLLYESTRDIQARRVGHLSAEQIGKFIEKARTALSPLYRIGVPPRITNPIAFFSTMFNPDIKNRYKARIERILKKGGYVPIMMDLEIAGGPLPETIRKHIAECSLFVVDLTGLRPDVLIETGAAWIQDTPIILLADRRECPPEKLPLLVKAEQILFYENDDQMEHMLKAALPQVKWRSPVLD